VLPWFGLTLTPFLAGILGLSLNFAAYGAEIVRGAILAVPRSQYDALIALNIGKWHAMRRIIFPQAAISMIPPFGNLCIDLLKSTALVSSITVGELTFAAYQVNREFLLTLQIFGVAMLIYYFLSQVVRIATMHLENRFARGISRGRS
jgi:polar amino acid transport system permease protein